MESINRNLHSSQLYFTPTIGSFLRIIFDLNANISSRVVQHVSAKSHNHHIGIAILEKQILQGTEERGNIEHQLAMERYILINISISSQTTSD